MKRLSHRNWLMRWGRKGITIIIKCLQALNFVNTEHELKLKCIFISNLIYYFNLIFINVHVYECVCHVCVGALRGLKKMSDRLVLV